MPQHVDNADLLARLIAWRSTPAFPDDIPEEITDTFLRLVDGQGRRANFSGYSFLDDMKGEAIMACCYAASRFNPAKSKNPFAYFTTCAWYAFDPKPKN